MDAPTRKDTVLSASLEPDERRRVGRVVHDERGNASVAWDDAPQRYERTKLELLDDCGPTPRSEQGCNPYGQRGAGATLRESGEDTVRRTRTDLRKLSEHIKRMRELEARKRRDEQD